MNIPASIPEVTAVGGTEFNEGSGTYWTTSNSGAYSSALSYIPETAWNDTSSTNGLSATGGGVSTFYLKPSWQSGPGVPADGHRDVPDISWTASPGHDGYLLYYQATLEAVGGTSLPAPALAGLIAILNQYLLAKGKISKPGLGNINPTLYQLSQTTPGIFHDVTTGSNIVPCRTGSPNCKNGSLGYSAGPGYDLVTGLGSIDANNLVTGWSGTPASISTTTTLGAAPSTISPAAGSLLTATVKPVSGAGVPTGTVTFQTATSSLGSSTLSGGIATLNVSGASLKPGTNTISATYGGSANYAPSTGTTSVTVTGGSTIVTNIIVSANPSSIAPGATTVVTAAVTPASGTTPPAGTVTFKAGNTALGSPSYRTSGNSLIATLTVAASSLSSGSNTISATYAGSATFAPSSATTSVTVTTPSGPDVTLSISPNPVYEVNGQFPFTITLTNSGGVSTRVTTFTFNGSNYSKNIQTWFGTNQIAAGASISAYLSAWGQTPGTYQSFTFTGVDAAGHKWTANTSVLFNGPKQ